MAFGGGVGAERHQDVRNLLTGACRTGRKTILRLRRLSERVLPHPANFPLGAHPLKRHLPIVPATRRGRERSSSAAEGATGPRKRSGNRDRVGIRDLWK